MRLALGFLCISLLLGHVAPAQPAAPDSLRPAELTNAYRISSVLDSVGECTEVLSWGTPAALVRTFYPTGQLHDYLPFSNLAAGLRHGMASSWYPSGQAAAFEPYVQGKRDGELLLYYEDGRLKRQASFRAGAEQHSRAYDAAGRPLAYQPYEQPPLYPGGLARLSHDINRQVRWTRELGRGLGPGNILVSISFLVGPDGRLSAPRVEVPSGVPLLDQAVLRAVAQLPRPWQPGRRDGLPQAFRYRLPIVFQVPQPYQPTRRL